MPDDGSYSFWRAHPKLTVTLATMVVAVVAGVGYVWVTNTVLRPPVYVTDGGHVFNDNLRRVEGKIKAENDWVKRSGKAFVSIAVLATMSPDPTVEPLDDKRTRHGIEGAYLAQYEANHPSGPKGRPGAPLVRLLLADEGSRESTWHEAVTALKGRVGSREHLVAVTGLGISVRNTTKVIRELGRAPHQTAMVASVITGDEFSDVPGLVRVAPTNTDEAYAAASFLDTDPDPDNPLPGTVKVWMVEDQNSADDYAHSLATALPRAVSRVDRHSRRHYRIMPPGTVYNSSLPDAQSVLQGLGDGVCHSGADVVYFAGRGVDLQGFLSGVAHRYCAARHPLTVLTGSDASQLADHGNLWPDGANMNVYYSALAHPKVWTHRPPVADPATVAWFDRPHYGFRSIFPGEALDDGWAIMFHDGVLTAFTAVRTLYVLTGAIPSAGAVGQELNQLTVHGASGYICFDRRHNPIDKAIPVARLDRHGRIRDVTLSSASGGPPAGDDCD